MSVVRTSRSPAPSLGRPAEDTKQLLQNAVDDFQAILTEEQRRKLASIGAIRDPDTVLIFTAQLDREHQARKGRGISARLLSVLQSVQQFSAVVDTFVSSHPEIAALVWGSVKMAMLLAVNFTSYFEALSQLFMRLSTQCPRFSAYQALYTTSTRLQTALCNFHASLIRCCQHAVEAIQRPWQKQLQSLFQSFAQEFEPDVSDLHRLADEVRREIDLAKAQADHQDQVLQDKEREAASKHRLGLTKFISKVENDLEKTDQMRLERSTRHSIQERQRLLNALSSYPHMIAFREARKKHHYNTAEWIFSTPEYTHWFEGTGPSLLWCSGKIGSGKTILCANIINHILTEKGRGDRVAFFFLQHDNADSLLAETVIRSLLQQSLDATALSKDAERNLRKLIDQEAVPTLNDWRDMLRQQFRRDKTVFLFLDGLDECEPAERRGLLDALANTPIRIFVTSRDSVAIDLQGRFNQMGHVSMTPATLLPDIRLYVEAAVAERKQNGDLAISDPRLENEVNTILTQHADGICDHDIRQSLHDLPKDLEETFARALDRILRRRERMAPLIQNIFRWVAVAKRPLTLDELREALSVKIGEFSIGPERLVREMSPIVLWCENLLQMSEEQERESVSFAHTTIRDFLTKATLPVALADFHVDIGEADHTAGEVCVRYLHLSEFTTTMTQQSRPLHVNNNLVEIVRRSDWQPVLQPLRAPKLCLRRIKTSLTVCL